MTQTTFAVPATYIAQERREHLGGLLADIPGKAIAFDAEFYLAQLTSEELDELTADPAEYVDQAVMQEALGYGTVSDHHGPFRVELVGQTVLDWIEGLRAKGLVTVGMVRGELAENTSDGIALATAADIFDDNYLLPFSAVTEALRLTSFRLSNLSGLVSAFLPKGRP